MNKSLTYQRLHYQVYWWKFKIIMLLWRMWFLILNGSVPPIVSWQIVNPLHWYIDFFRWPIFRRSARGQFYIGGFYKFRFWVALCRPNHYTYAGKQFRPFRRSYGDTCIGIMLGTRRGWQISYGKNPLDCSDKNNSWRVQTYENCSVTYKTLPWIWQPFWSSKK